MESLALPASVIAFFAIVVFLVGRHEQRLRTTWEQLAEGDFDRIEYEQVRSEERSGAMAHTNRTVWTDRTIIRLRDGRAYAGWGKTPASFPKGTRVRVMQNGRSRLKLERAA